MSAGILTVFPNSKPLQSDICSLTEETSFKGSYSFSSEDAEKSSMEDRLLEKSSVSINYCEIGPRLHGLSSAYNSSTGERSVEVTTTSSSYSGYTKIIESSEPLSVESVSSNWHKSSVAIEKREKITDEGSDTHLNHEGRPFLNDS